MVGCEIHQKKHRKDRDLRIRNFNFMVEDASEGLSKIQQKELICLIWESAFLQKHKVEITLS